MAPLAPACAPRLPKPRDAVRAYADAVEKGDADALYEMLTEKSRRHWQRDDLRALVEDVREELAQQARELSDEGATISTVARVRYPDGEIASLDFEGGAFKIATADALPGGGRSPEEALEQLRRVLARRSYPGLMRVLTKDSRSAIESEVRSLVVGLEHPEGLEIEVEGERATVRVEGGHSVRLRREDGLWKIEDFD